VETTEEVERVEKQFQQHACLHVTWPELLVTDHHPLADHYACLLRRYNMRPPSPLPLLKCCYLRLTPAFVAFSMEELFRTADVHNILDFIKETHFYSKL